MNILTLDFETLDKYLGKSTKAKPMGGLGAGWIYKNEDNFKVLGVSLKEDDREPYYLDLTIPKNIDILKTKVKQCKILLAHNASYELGILWRLGIDWEDKVVLDTETIARLYNSEEDEYNLGYLAKKYLTNTRKVKDTLGKAAFDKGLCRWKTYDEKKCSKWALENMDVMQKECYDVVEYYANMDVQATYELFKHYMNSAKLDRWDISKFKELCIEKSMLCKASVWMRTRGVRVDLKRLREIKEEFTPILAGLAQKIFDIAGEEFEIGGKLDKIRIFDKLGIKYPVTSKGNPSFTGDWLAEQDHPLCQAIAEYNECKKNFKDFVLKIEEIQQFTLDISPEEVQELDYGIVYPEINVMRARTGRFSCRGPNLQQIPSSKVWGPLCRSIYVPHEGETMYSADWASQENRIMIDLAYKKGCEGAQEYVDAFNKDAYLDIHMMVAVLMGLSCGNNKENDKNHCKICSEGRGPAKAIGLGLAYSMGLLKLAISLGLLKGLPELSVPLDDILLDLRKNKGKPKKTTPEDYKVFNTYYKPKLDEAKDLVSRYKEASKYVISLDETAKREMKIKGYVTTEMGRRIHKAKSIWVDGEKFDFEYKALNSLIQGCLDGDTVVFTKKGAVKLKEISGQEVELWDGEEFVTGKCVPSGKKRKCIISLYDGSKLITSPDHRILTINSAGNEIWRRTGEIEKTNNLLLKLGNKCDNLENSVDILEFGAKYNSVKNSCPGNYDPISFSEVGNYFQLGEILGRLASDGSVSKDKNISFLFADHEIEVEKYMLPIINRLGTPTINRKTNHTQEVRRYMLNKTHLARQAEELNIKTDIPYICWENTELMRGYLRGMFDGDGTVNKEGVAILTFGKQEYKKDWAKNIQLALRLFGIKSRVRHYSGDRTVVQVSKAHCHIFKKEIGFIHTKKMNRLPDSHQKTSRNGIKIKSIEISDEYIEMYDICDTKNERFVANGYVVHNSASDDMGRVMVECYKRKLPILLPIHDQFLISSSSVEKALEIKYLMENLNKKSIPYCVDMDEEGGKSWDQSGH